MVFTVYADDTLIYHSQSPSPDVKLINPKLTLEDTAAGSFSCTIPPSNIAYGNIDKFTTTISVFRDDKCLFEGRVIDEREDFFKNRDITCEGALSYLNDTTQPPAEYHNQTVRGFLETLISIHNQKASAGRTFRVGVVTVTDPNDSLYRYTNFESTLECIQDKLTERLGGHILIRYENGARYIDYLSEPINTNTQTIEFGKNLLDFSKSWDISDFATVIVPQGARLDESPIEALDAYLDVKSVNSGSIYVYNQQTVDNYGWIETVVRWDDVTEASNLLSKAQTYLSEIQFDKMTLEVNAVDLSYMGGNVENIELFDKVRCVSTPHGMDRFFTVTRVDIPLDNPENTTFTLGDNTVKSSLSASIKRENQKIKDYVDMMPSTTSVLDEAMANSEQIMHQLSNGYITTVIQGTGENAHSEELIISDTQNYLNASHYWKWNINGLAHYKRQNNQMVIDGVAMTMDGQINADMITTGTMSADRVRTGSIRSTDGKVAMDLTNGTFSLVSTNLKIETNGMITTIGEFYHSPSGRWHDRKAEINGGKVEFFSKIRGSEIWNKGGSISAGDPDDEGDEAIGLKLICDRWGITEQAHYIDIRAKQYGGSSMSPAVSLYSYNYIYIGAETGVIISKNSVENLDYISMQADEYQLNGNTNINDDYTYVSGIDYEYHSNFTSDLEVTERFRVLSPDGSEWAEVILSLNWTTNNFNSAYSHDTNTIDFT